MQLLIGLAGVAYYWDTIVFVTKTGLYWLTIGFVALLGLSLLAGLLRVMVGGNEGPAPAGGQHSKPWVPALRDTALNKVGEIIERHIETLARRRMSLIVPDHYGVVDTTGWDKEVQHFISKVVLPELTATERFVAEPKGTLYDRVRKLIEERAKDHVCKLKATFAFDLSMSPVEFEQWCAAQLSKAGWSARTTHASGDQGADVIAEKAGIRVVIQCKLYQSPVGNKAVQEAFAARQHYSAAVAAVVTNGGFTPSARELAATTSVILIPHTELDRFDERLVDRGLLTHRPEFSAETDIPIALPKFMSQQPMQSPQPVKPQGTQKAPEIDALGARIAAARNKLTLRP